jgi:putative hydrolases of HD superfamily
MQQVIDFVLEIDRLKGVTRAIRPRGLDRYENSAEHSWQLALLALSLVSYAAQPVDLNRVIRMLLVHDIGEIETGDTIVYNDTGLAERKAGELRAVTRIFGLLPAAQSDELMSLWLEFEANDTAEARFAHAADRAMPVILNLANEGQSWREHGITHARVLERVGPPIQAGCPALWAHLEARLLTANANGWFGSR